MTLSKTLFNLGIHPKQTLSERRSIRFTNFSLIYGLAFCFVCVFTNLYFIGLKGSIVPLLFFGLLAIGFHFQRKHQFKKAKFFVFCTSVVGIIASCWVFGLKGFPFFLFLLTFCVGMVFYPQKRQQIKLLLLHICCLAITLGGASIIPPPLEIPYPFIFGVMTFVFVQALLFFIIQTYTKENQIFELQTNQLVASLQEKNTQIEKQKADLQGFNKKLHKEIEAKNMAQEQLRASNEQLRRFVYVASHDLKEPLRTIGAFSHLLERQTNDQLDDSSKTYLNFITSGVTRMTQLLEDLLAYSRIENQTNLQKEVINLNELIGGIEANLANLIQRNQGRLIISKNLPTIYGFPTQIQQLLQNLISNALKFRGEAAPIVQITWEEKAQYFVFAIKDNGIGIASNHQAKIFEAFQRLHKNEYEGTGIGLAICKKVVNNHQGKIWLESIEGVGTTFYFSIKKVHKSALVGNPLLKQIVK